MAYSRLLLYSFTRPSNEKVFIGIHIELLGRNGVTVAILFSRELAYNGRTGLECSESACHQ